MTTEKEAKKVQEDLEKAFLKAASTPYVGSCVLSEKGDYYVHVTLLRAFNDPALAPREKDGVKITYGIDSIKVDSSPRLT